MSTIINSLSQIQRVLNKIKSSVDFIGPLLLRIYLVPVFFIAGVNKWDPLAEGGTYNPVVGLENITNWFGNADWGLGLPFPFLLALLAWSAEYFGAILLALGLAVRWITIPLLVVMVVAVTSVHWENGWQSVHDAKSPYAAEDIADVNKRKKAAISIMKKHGNYSWLKERGNFVILNNGIEWAATYFLMVLTLFFLGGGRYVSVDYWLARKFYKHTEN